MGADARRGVVASLTTFFCLAAALALAAPSPAAATEAGVLSGTVSPTMQTNGTVWHLAYARGAIYALGDFTTVRPSGAPAGSREIRRRYLAAFDSATGALLPFRHTFDSRPTSIAASPDGSRLYVGGSFTHVDGASTGRLVAFDTATGGRVARFGPRPSGRVAAIAATDGAVYYSGYFSAVGPARRSRAAAADAATGATLPWAPTLDVPAVTMSVTGDGARVFLGGNFNVVDGQPQREGAEVDGASGASLPFAAARAFPPKTSTCTSIAKDTLIAGGVVYFAAEGTGGGCFDGTLAADVASGALRWKNTCLGATQSVAVVRGWLYKGSHAHDCRSQNSYGDPDAFPQVAAAGQSRHLLAERLDNGFLGPWYPQTNGGGPKLSGLGPRAMATDGTNLWVGGQFTYVDHRPQQGLARFAPNPDTPPNRPLAPTVAATGTGTVTVRATVPLDLDDTDLVVRLYRDGRRTPVATSTVQHSLFWRQPVVRLTERGLAGGSRHTYRVDAVEAFGSRASRLSAASAAVTVQRGASAGGVGSAAP